MVLGDAVSTLEVFVWILNHVSRSITYSVFTLKASNLTCSNDDSQRDLSCGGASLSIS